MRRRAPGQPGPEPCLASLVVLDFDGTLTDADAHAPAFHEASRRELARHLGCDAATVRREWERARAMVEALPPQAAWTAGGVGVCPARADPYIVANAVAKLLLAERGPGAGEETVMARVLEVHHAAYQSVPPPFRSDAGPLLEALGGSGRQARVVTNSSTATVERLLDSLGGGAGRARPRVHENANKFAVCAAAVPDPRFASLPETVDCPEVGRPVHLRRGRYFDALRAMWDETGAAPEATLVVGDIVELDLAMPATLGAHVHLVVRPSTMPHEPRLARALARGDADASLLAVLRRLSARG